MPEQVPTPDSEQLTQDKIYNLLKEDSNEEKEEDASVEEDSTEEDETKEGDDSESSESDESDESEDKSKEIELVDEEEIPTEEQEEEWAAAPISRKALLTKYPNIFKEFPGLEKGYYRDQKYAEFFPTIEDAKEAKEKVEILQGFETALFSGNNEAILNEVKSKDPKAFGKLVDNYLPSIYKADQSAYFHIVTEGVVKPLVMKMLNDAKNSNDEDLQKSAAALYRYVFPGQQFNEPQKFSKEADKPEVDIEKQKFEAEQFNAVLSDLSTRVDNVLISTVSNNIDPKGMMSEYVKKNAVRDCVDGIHKAIIADKRFKAAIDGLWREAKKSNYSMASREKIRQTYLSKAKTLIPSMIQKVRNEAVKGSRPVSTKSEETKSSRLPVGKTAGSTVKKSGKAEFKGGRTLDYFMQD